MKNSRRHKMLAIKNDQSGVVLFMVLWILMLLSVIVGEFCSAMRTEVNITRNFKERAQALYIAEAGVNRAVAELLDTQGQPISAEDADGAGDDQILWRINSKIGPVPYAQGGFDIRIDNESGKVNLNRAGKPLLRQMLSSFDLADNEKDVIVDSIFDWRDADSLHQLNGAENDYYHNLPDPYDCKNGDFDAVEELLWVRGVTSDLFHGGLKSIVSVVGSDAADSSDRRRPGSRRTVYNYNRININAAAPRMLLSLPRMTPERVRLIVDYRQNGDFRSPGDLAAVVGSEVYAAAMPYVSVQNTPWYTVRSVGRIDGSRTQKQVRVLLELDPVNPNSCRILERG